MSDSSFAQQLLQLSRQQGAARPLLVSGSSREPPATSLQSLSTAASSQHMVPPIQAGCSVSGIFSNLPATARPPLINSLSSSPGDFQAGGEIRAPAPHLQSYRPSTSVPASSLPPLPQGMPSQQPPSNVPATSPMFSHGPPRPRPTTYRSGPQMGRWSDSAGGLSTPNLPAMDLRGNASSQPTMNLPNVLSHMSGVASAKLSRFGTNSSSVLPNSLHQATPPDLVCLSDDD